MIKWTFYVLSSLVVFTALCSILLKSEEVISRFDGSLIILNSIALFRVVNIYILAPATTLIIIISVIICILSILATPYLTPKGYHFSNFEKGLFLLCFGLRTTRLLPSHEEMKILPGYTDGTYDNISRMIKEIQELRLKKKELSS